MYTFFILINSIPVIHYIYFIYFIYIWSQCFIAIFKIVHHRFYGPIYKSQPIYTFFKIFHQNWYQSWLRKIQYFITYILFMFILNVYFYDSSWGFSSTTSNQMLVFLTCCWHLIHTKKRNNPLKIFFQKACHS